MAALRPLTPAHAALTTGSRPPAVEHRIVIAVHARDLEEGEEGEEDHSAEAHTFSGTTSGDGTGPSVGAEEGTMVDAV